MRCFHDALVCLTLAALVGCNRPEDKPKADAGDGKNKSPDAPPKKRGTIGVSVMTVENPFFKVIGDSIAAEAAKQGYDTIVLSGGDDPVRQAAQVKDFIVKRVAAIVLCPCNSQSIGEPIREANAAGIPVFTADVACLSSGAKVVCHVATDNYAGGKVAGDAMVELLAGGGGRIAILAKPSVESCLLRVKGFREVIDAHNAKAPAAAKIEIVKELDADGDRAKGYKAAEDIIQAHSDLTAIFAINDPSALGARAALERAGKADQVRLIGFDGQPEGRKAIRDGKIFADPIQFPDRIGIETVNVIVKHFRGEPVAPQLLIPTALYRKADAEKDASLK